MNYAVFTLLDTNSSQEFVDARRRAIQNAPQVLFRNEPPLELQHLSGLQRSSKGNVGYITFGRCSAPSFYDNLVDRKQYFSQDISSRSDVLRLSRISKRFVITFIIISKRQRSTELKKGNLRRTDPCV